MMEAAFFILNIAFSVTCKTSTVAMLGDQDEGGMPVLIGREGSRLVVEIH
jgi:hypothetical protein